MNETKIRLVECENPTEAAVMLERTIAEVLTHYMVQGLTVSNAVGVLTCVASEITLSFNLKKGMVDSRIEEVVRDLS